MGMLDKYGIFADHQAVTVVGDTLSTNQYQHMFVQATDMGMTTENLWINVVANTPVAGGAGATVQAVLQDSADGLAWADVASGPVVTATTLSTGGGTIAQFQPPVNTRQWLRVVFRVAGAALTGGTFSAFVSNTIQHNIARPSGFMVV